MRTIELSSGPIEYEDTGGNGPVLVLLHGLRMDAVGRTDRRPVRRSPMPGTHAAAGRARHPMHRDADLSLPGIARLVAEFLDRLGLHEVTLVGNDTGGAVVQLLMRLP
jgi:pimeloyl-ACP methyl ester carboxylesterase